MKKIIIAFIVLILTFSAAGLAEIPTADRAGNAVSIPENVQKIISLAPATTQILEAIGAKDRIIAVDNQTPLYVEGFGDVPQFDMMAPDVESIAALEPDIVYTTGMSYIDGNPYQALTDMGICVVEIPSSSSIAAVAEDIVFTGACLGLDGEAEALAEDMLRQIEEIRAIGAAVEDKKTVFFEISALPYIYSCGQGTFINEMIEGVGAVNVMGDQAGWLAVTEEDAVAANPDVILTSVNYIEDSVGEIMSRSGWENVTAVANGAVYYIDNAASSLPNQYIAKAMLEIALAVYPDLYADYAAANEAA